LPDLQRTRRRQTFASWAAFGSPVISLGLLAAIALPCASGCATFGRRGPSAETAAACRELTRQGVAALEAGQYEQAESLLRQSLESGPEDADTHRFLAETLWRRGAQSEALAQMAEVIRLEPVEANHSVRAGEMSLAMGQRDAALAYAEQAIRCDPKLSTAWALRGRTFWQLNESDRAIADLQRSLAIAPASTDVLLDVAAIYRSRGQHARCLATLHRLTDAYSPAEEPQSVLLLEGLALLDLGRAEQAVEPLTLAAHRGPANVEVFYALAQAQSAAGRYAEARANAEQALALDAGHQLSRELLAQLATHAAPAETQRR
jgi:tetratricopeptide (TPR) repeat protein